VSELDEDERRFTVGEVAKSTGLTVRTLQHYDNIGILPTSGRTESGRRYYIRNDILKLEQIVFYKSLGISLNEIKEKLIDAPTSKRMEQMLIDHLDILLSKISSLHTAVSMIEVSLEELRSSGNLPWEACVGLIRTLEGSSLKDWANYKFDHVIYDNLELENANASDIMDTYLSIRSLLVEAAMLSKLGRSAGDPAAQALAKRWWDLILVMTGGDETVVNAFQTVDKNREEWPEADQSLYQAAEPFLEEALGIYITVNHIEVPDSLK
jgi:DNA-binding transcriptional MerR regulator